MQTGLQILEQPFRTKNLFSKHYLETSFKDPKQNPYWDKVNDESAQAFKQITELWLKKSKILIKLKESQLEDEFIRPVLKALGHVWDVQATIPHAFGTFGTPDYAFFRDEETKNKIKQDKHIEYFKATIGIGEAKAWNENLDKRKKAKEKEQRVIPSSQINTYLKVSGVKWGILTNGRLWRLYYRETSFNLDSYYETDLPELLQFGSVEQFKYFFLLFRKEAFVPDEAGRCFLDDVYDRSIELAKELEENVKENVYEALKLLAYGFLEHPDNKLDQGRLKEIHDNCLILLYRLLFALYAEARGLLPADNPVYASVSLHQLKKDVAAALSSPTKVLLVDSSTYWSRLKTLFSWINEGSEKRKIPKEQLHIPPYNGGLFDPSRHPFLENNKIGDKYLAKATELLTRAGNSKAGIKGFIDYSTLSIRHLGSIYEGLLEYKLRVADQDLYTVKEKGREVFVPLADIQKQKKGVDDSKIVHKEDLYLVTDKGERKATGSYFTSDYIVKYIVESTLGPIVEEKKALKNGSSPIENILSIKVLDPAMGSGHFLVEATSFLASKIIDAMQEAGEEVDEGQDIVWARRLVVERCIYGVDLNPLAVELAKVSLWLHTIAQDKALSFLDHHLKCGNSLIGAKIEEIAKGLPTEKAKSTYTLWGSHLKVTMKEALAKCLAIQFMPSDTPEQIKDKERILRESDELVRRSKQVADLYLSTYFGNDLNLDDYAKVMGDIALIEDEWLKYEKKEWYKKALELARGKRFFQWELEFPEVFFDESGPKDNAGFDAVIGNPPYERTKYLVDDLNTYDALFVTAYGAYDIYVLFIERSLSLLNMNGEFGYITSNKYLVTDYGSRARKLLCQSSSVWELVDLTECPSTFPGVLVSPILTFSSKKPRQRTRIAVIKKDDLTLLSGLPAVFLSAKDGVYEDENFAIEIRPIQNLLDKNLDQINLYLVGIKKLLVDRLYKVSDYLANVSELRTGVMGFEYWSLEPLVEDKSSLRPNELKLLPPSLINRYENLWGLEPVDLYKKRYQFPVLHRDPLKINQSTWDFFRKEKVVVRGVARKLSAILDEEGHALLVAVHGIIPHIYSQDYFGALLNSRLLDWLHVGQFYGARIPQGSLRYPVSFYKSLPIRRISFTTSEKVRKQLLDQGKNLYKDYLHTLNWERFLSFVAQCLPLKPDGYPDTEHEQSDVVHDMLAFLAEEMTRLHKEKQTEIKGFLTWLEGYLGVSVEDFKNKTKAREYWKGNVGWDSFISALEQNRRAIETAKSIDVTHREPRETIRTEFDKSVAKLKPLLERINLTDKLIDKIVYRLYGLTDEEVAVVEGRS